MTRVIDVLLRCVAAESEEDRMKAIQEARDILDAANLLSEELPLEKRARDLLVLIGMPTNLYGFQYVIDAIQLCYNDEKYLRDITKRVYPEIAKKRGKSKYCIEKSIRLAIETAWDRGDLDVLYRMFGNTVSRDKGRPTNAEFLSRLVMELR